MGRVRDMKRYDTIIIARVTNPMTCECALDVGRSQTSVLRRNHEGDTGYAT